jgi:hypothetical protein
MTPEELMSIPDGQHTATPPPAPKPKGWWRRNILALIGLVPVLALVIGIGFIDPFYRFWQAGPLRPVSADAQGIATIDGIQFRLEELTKVELKDFGGKAILLPVGTLAWKAVVEIKAPDQEKVGLCHFFVEDKAGKLYGDGPDELSKAKGATSFSTCTSSDEKASAAYRVTVYFLLPALAKPEAVRVTWITRYPDYIRLPARVR